MNTERYGCSNDLLVEEQRSNFKSAIAPIIPQILQEDGYLAAFVLELSEKQREAFVGVSIEIAGVRKFGRRSDEKVSLNRGGKSIDRLQDKWEKAMLKEELEPLHFMGMAATFAETLEVVYENDPAMPKKVMGGMDY